MPFGSILSRMISPSGTTWPCFNIAHRGARSLAPENTMAAFVKAWEIGAHGIEVDVRITQDNRLILFHDETLIRTTDIRSKIPERSANIVESFTYNEIQKLDAGSWFIENDPFGEIAAGSITDSELKNFSGIKIPTLEEIIIYVKEQSWFINIELKRSDDEQLVERVFDLLDQCRISPRYFSISSFNHGYLRSIRHLRPDIEINALIGEFEYEPQDWGSFEFAVYNANKDLIDDDQIRTALANGCRVNLYTVNDPQQMLHYLDTGVDKIITDYPQILQKLRPV